jgi:hypothetical protein
MDFKPRKVPPRIVTIRNCKKMDIEKFKLDLQVHGPLVKRSKMSKASIQYGQIYSRIYVKNMHQKEKLSFGDKHCRG